MKNKRLILIFILFLFSFSIRIYNIENKGMWWHDEGTFYLSAKTCSMTFEYIKNYFLGNETRTFKEFLKYLSTNGGWVPLTAYYFYIFILSLFMFVVGYLDFTPFLLNVFLGLGTILIVYKIANIFYDDFKIAILSAFIFSFAPLVILIDRSGFSITSSIFFMMLSVYYYLSFLRKNCIKLKYFSFVIAGISFGCHYNMVIYLFLLFIFEILSIMKKRKKVYKNILILFFFLFLMPALCQIFTLSVKTIIKDKISNYNVNFLTYFESIQERTGFFSNKLLDSNNKSNQNIFRKLFFYPLVFFKMNGILYSILFYVIFIYSIFYLINNRKNYEKIIIIYLFLGIFLFWFLCPEKRIRCIAMIFPFVAILSGKFFISLEKYFNRKTIYFIVSLICFSGLYYSLDFLNVRSSYSEVYNYIKDKYKTKRFMATMSRIFRCYAGIDNVKYPIFSNINELYDIAIKNKYKYLCIDHMKFFHNQLVIDEFEKKNKPIIIFDNKACDKWFIHFDFPENKSSGKIRIYELNIFPKDRQKNVE